MEPPEGPDSMGCPDYRSSSFHLFRVRAPSNGRGSDRSSAGDEGSQKDAVKENMGPHVHT